jgi:hypothetical protein
LFGSAAFFGIPMRQQDGFRRKNALCSVSLHATELFGVIYDMRRCEWRLLDA